MRTHVSAHSGDMATEPKVGMRIRTAMERMRMNQQQLADVLGVSRSAVNNWINDRAYPQNSIGALNHVLGIDLRAPSDPLPDYVIENQDDPRVIEVLNMTTIQMATKLAVIRHILAEEAKDGTNGPDRRRG